MDMSHELAALGAKRPISSHDIAVIALRERDLRDINSPHHDEALLEDKIIRRNRAVSNLIQNIEGLRQIDLPLEEIGKLQSSVDELKVSHEVSPPFPGYITRELLEKEERDYENGRARGPYRLGIPSLGRKSLPFSKYKSVPSHTFLQRKRKAFREAIGKSADVRRGNA